MNVVQQGGKAQASPPCVPLLNRNLSSGEWHEETTTTTKTEKKRKEKKTPRRDASESNI
jgi:hypothetical protein